MDTKASCVFETLKFLTAGISTQNWVSFTLKIQKTLKGVTDYVFVTKQDTSFSYHLKKQKLTFREDFWVPSTMVISTLHKLPHLTHETILTR